MNNPLINPGLGTFVWMMVSFAILVFILAKWGWPMLLRALKSREDEIERQLSEAEKAREEIHELQVRKENALRVDMMEREEILKKAREKEKEIIESALDKAQEVREKKIKDAEEDAMNLRNRALNDMRNELGMIAIDLAEKLLRDELSDQERAREFVKNELEKIK